MSNRSAVRSLLRPLAGVLRALRDASSPFPLPAYGSTPPAVAGDDPLAAFLPPTAQTLAEAAMSEKAANFVSSVLEKLTPSRELDAGRYFYRAARARYGRHWRYADLPTALWAAALLLRPERYLEVGVRQGRSTAVVGAMCPRCEIYGFDLWTPGYHAAPNPGPDFVREELASAGHRGPVELVSGDSRRTLPSFLRAHPGIYFDLMTIDGDKSVHGFASDLAKALPRLKLGGIVLCDDLATVPAMRRVWRRVIERDARYTTWEFSDAGTGIAAAIRVG